MAGYAHVYRPADATGPLRQGEVLSDLVRYRTDPRQVGEKPPPVLKITYPFAVVVSQDCDLTQQGRVEFGDLAFPTVLLVEAPPAADLRGKKDINSGAWNLIKQNREERYHFLQAVPAEQDAQRTPIEELGLDFKRYFAVPTDELYALLAAGMARRRCVLKSPYMEHLCSRFVNYLSRVALPEQHFSTPGG